MRPTREAPDALDAVERAVRPLRRVLARRAAGSSAPGPHFAAALARLAAPVRALDLPDELAPLRDAVVGPLTADGPVDERLSDAWQALTRLDDVLGLRLRATPVRRPSTRRVRLTTAVDEVPETDAPAPSRTQGTADRAADAAPAAPEPSPPAQASLSWSTTLSDVDIDDELAAALEAAGIRTVWEAARRAPAEVEVIEPVLGAGMPLPDGRVAVGGRVTRRVTRCRPDGGLDSVVTLQGAGPVEVRWAHAFDGDALAVLGVGQKVVVAARHADGALSGGQRVVAHDGRVVLPRYAEEDGGEALGEVLPRWLELLADEDDVVSGTVLERHGLPRLADAVAALHRGEVDAARTRLAFDEALVLQLGTSVARFGASPERGIAHPLVHRHVAELEQRGFGPLLDDAGQRAFEDVKRDLRGPTPGARVLHGGSQADPIDVALQAVLTVVEGRSQVLVVAEDAPTAQTLRDRWDGVLGAFGITVLLVAGEPRRADQEALKRGDVHVVVASPSAWDLGLEWRRLGLVVAFEQAVYGDAPLRVAGLRTPRPDLLVVARSPLPSAVWWGAYPVLDATGLAGTGAPAHGTIWAEADRQAAYAALGEAVSEGRSALVAFPMRRGGTDLLTLREAEELAASLKRQALSDVEVAVVHGAQTGRERIRAWTDFVERRVRVLVSTTMIEWLPRPPRGVVGLVEHADRLDPQRLLSLRAWVGEAGHLHLVLGDAPDAAREARVRAVAAGQGDADVVHAFPDGYELAPALQALPQPATRWLDPTTHGAQLAAARETVHTVLSADPGLRQGAHARLARLARAAWSTLQPDVPCPIPEVRVAPSKRRRRRRRRR